MMMMSRGRQRRQQGRYPLVGTTAALATMLPRPGLGLARARTLRWLPWLVVVESSCCVFDLFVC